MRERTLREAVGEVYVKERNVRGAEERRERERDSLKSVGERNIKVRI